MAFKNSWPSKLSLTINTIALDQLALIAIIFISWISFFILYAFYSPLWLTFNVICTFLLVMNFKFSDQKLEIHPESLTSIFTSLVFIVIFALHRYLHIDQYIFWLDEYTQIVFSRVQGDLVHSSATEQQPFLSYLLTRIIHTLAPTNINFHRLVGMLPTGLALLIFFNRIKSSNLLLSLSLIPVFVFNWDWLYHSYEIRGIGTGLLGSAIWFCSIDRFLKSSGGWKNSPQLILSSFVFLNMIGIQPPFILLCATLALFPLIFMRKTRPRALTIILSHTTAVLLFLPAQIYTLKLASQLSKFKPDIKSSLLSYFNDYRFPFLETTFTPFTTTTINLSLGILLYLVIIASVAYFFIKKKYLYSALLFGILLFPFVYDLAFNAVIKWDFMRRYADCWRMLVIVIPLCLIAHLKYKRATALFGILLSCLVIFQSGTTSSAIHDIVKYRFNWKNLYLYLDEKITKDSDVFLIGACDRDLGQWCPNFFIGPEFYLDSNKLDAVVSKHSTPCPEDILDCSGIVHYLENDQTSKSEGNVVVVYNYKFNIRPGNYRSLYQFEYEEKDFKIHNVSDFLVIEATGTQNRVTLADALERTCNLLPLTKYNFRICEYATRVLIKNNEKTRALNTLARLEEMLKADSTFGQDTSLNQSYQAIKNKLDQI